MHTPFAPTPIVIDALAFQDASGVWIAQCIQYDIVAQAKSLPALPKALEQEIFANLCVNAKLGREGLDGIPPAPQRYQEEFKEATLGLSPNYKFKSLSSTKQVHLHDLKVAEMA